MGRNSDTHSMATAWQCTGSRVHFTATVSIATMVMTRRGKKPDVPSLSTGNQTMAVRSVWHVANVDRDGHTHRRKVSGHMRQWLRSCDMFVYGLSGW